MRLFYAVLLDDCLCDALCDAACRLEERADSGRFTRRENFHLTLAFIGETPRLRDAQTVLRSVHVPAFPIVLAGTGRFRRNGGDIWWAGLAPSPPLMELHRKLVRELSRAGFLIENRPFTPHLTLGRQIRINGDPQIDIEAARMTVRRLSLMRSERINGKLTYTETDGQPLEDV